MMSGNRNMITPRKSGGPAQAKVAADAGASSAIRRPCFHQRAAFLEQLPTPIGGFSLVRDRVRERHFNHLVRRVGFLCSPISEARAESVGSYVSVAHADQQRAKGIFRQPLA